MILIGGLTRFELVVMIFFGVGDDSKGENNQEDGRTTNKIRREWGVLQVLLCLS